MWDPGVMVQLSLRVALTRKVQERRALGGFCAVRTPPAAAGTAKGPSGKPWAPAAIAGEGAEKQGRAPLGHGVGAGAPASVLTQSLRPLA